jgi:hypothetical protein
MSNVNSIRITEKIEDTILPGYLREKIHYMIEKDSEVH